MKLYKYDRPYKLEFKKLCKCGCGKKIVESTPYKFNNRKFYSVKCIHNFSRGKSLEERFGKEIADKIKKIVSKKLKVIKNSRKMLKWARQTFEDRYGSQKAKEIKKKLIGINSGTFNERFDIKTAKRLKENLYKASNKVAKFRKGKNYIQIYGKSKAESIKCKLSKSNSGTLEKRLGKIKSDIMKKNATRIMKKVRSSGKLNIFPNGYENRIIELIKKYNLPYKYTGNGKFWIDGKINPDFKHNYKKIIIEVFCDYWKIKRYGSIKNFKNRHNNICRRQNYLNPIYINQQEIKKSDEYLLNKLGGDKNRL